MDFTLFVFVEELDGAEVGVVDVFHDLVVVLDAEEVFCNLSFEHEVEVVVALGGAKGFEGFLRGVAHHTFLNGSSGKEAVETEGIVVLEEELEGFDLWVFAVAVSPLEREAVEESFAAEGDVVVGEAHGIHGDEEVGHDAAAPVNGAAMGSLILQ